MQKSAEALGELSFDTATFAERISEIQVVAPDQLRFVFRDDHSMDLAWRNPSRRESWTEEMRRQARKRQLARCERRENG